MPAWVVQASRAVPLDFGTGLTRYLPPWGGIPNQTLEAYAVLRAGDAYTLSNLLLRVTANTLTAASTLRSRINYLNGNQLITIPAGATGLFEDAANSDAWPDGQGANSQLVTGATGTSISISLTSFLLFAATAIPMLGWSNDGGSWPILTRDCVVTGAPNPSGISSAYTFRAAATFTNLFLSIESNTWTQTATWRPFIQGAFQNLIINIPVGGTGWYTDLVNADTVAVGNTVLMYMSPAAVGAGDMQVRGHLLRSASAGRQTVATWDWTFTPGTRYNAVEGPLYTAAAEAYCQGEANTSIAARNLYVRVGTSAHNAACTVALRQNGADTALQVTIPAGTMGIFEDLTDIVSLMAADLINYRVTIGGTIDARIDQIGFQQGPAAAAAGFGGGLADKMRAIGAI